MGAPARAGPFTLPLALRFTDPSGRALVSEQAIKLDSTSTTDANLAKFYQDFYYIDTGVQF